MSVKHRIVLIIIISINNLLEIQARCGYPELPSMAASIENKEYFEEDETLKIRCIGSVVIGQTMDDNIIKCVNNRWNTTELRCSQIQTITEIDIQLNGKQEEKPDLKEREFKYLSDNNPTTCVSLRDEEKWFIHLNESKLVSNVALIATLVEDKTHLTKITVSIGEHICELEKSKANPESPILFFIYKCPVSIRTENVSIHLQADGNDINICGIDVFTIIDNDCGKPELPLYSFANQMKVQNGTKIADYVCAKGYQMNGSPLRTCGSDGLWYPTTPPTCTPIITCDSLEEEDLNNTFKHVYNDFDMFGNAMPDLSAIEYQCVNDSYIIAKHTVRYCQINGNWSEINGNLVCHHKSNVIVVFGKYMITHDKHILYFGAFGLILLFIGSFIILFHMRRLAKKISRQMRENAYLSQDKSLPNYNSEANYQDLTSMFTGDTTAPPAIPAVQEPNTNKF